MHKSYDSDEYYNIDDIEIRGNIMKKKRKRSALYSMYSTPSTGGKYTKVKTGATANDRFNIDDKVIWDGEKVGTIVGFCDDYIVQVRWSDGSITQAPGHYALLKHLPVEPDFEELDRTYPDTHLVEEDNDDDSEEIDVHTEPTNVGVMKTLTKFPLKRNNVCLDHDCKHLWKWKYDAHDVQICVYCGEEK